MEMYDKTILQDIDIRIWTEIPLKLALAWDLPMTTSIVERRRPEEDGKKYTWDDLERKYFENRAMLEPFLDWFWNHEY